MTNIRSRIKFGITITGVLLLIAALLVNLVRPNNASEDDLSNSTIKVSTQKTLDCTTCHTGQATFKARDTINRVTCNNCHKEDTELLIPAGSEVHKFHEGNLSMLPQADYIERHKIDTGVSCDSCHVFAPSKTPECGRCHKGNDHVSRKEGICSSCHGYLNEPFKHDRIELVTHDKFGEKSCSGMCHSDDRVSLRLINNVPVPIADSSRLCRQCHYGVYNSWKEKNHFSVQTCVDCHDPHDPTSNLGNISKILGDKHNENQAWNE